MLSAFIGCVESALKEFRLLISFYLCVKNVDKELRLNVEK
jgi:hypothetical protein